MRLRKLYRHTGRHVLGPPCGHRGSSGTLYCDEPAGHIGPHVDASEVGTISWPREVRLAIEAPKREPEPERPSWRERLAGGVSALIDATARGMARLIDHGVLEEELTACAMHAEPDDEPEDVSPARRSHPSRRCRGARRATGERWDDDDDPAPAWPEIADSPEQRSSVFADRSGERSGTGPGHPEVMHAVRVGDTYVAGSGPPIGPWCACIIGCGEARATVPVLDCPVHGTLPPEPEERTEVMGAIRVPAHRNVRNRWPMPPRRESHWEQYTRAFGVPESLRYVAEILAAPLPQVKALSAG